MHSGGGGRSKRGGGLVAMPRMLADALRSGETMCAAPSKVTG